MIGVHRDVRVHAVHGFLCGLHLRLAHIICRVDYLSLEVGEVNHVRVNDTDSANSCRHEVHCRRST